MTLNLLMGRSPFVSNSHVDESEGSIQREVRLSLCCNYCLLLIQTEIILQDRTLLHSHTIFTILIVKPHFCPDRLGRIERLRFASTIYYFHDNLIRFQLNEINPKVALLDSVHQPMYGNVERTFNQMDLKQIKLLNQNITRSSEQRADRYFQSEK